MDSYYVADLCSRGSFRYLSITKALADLGYDIDTISYNQGLSITIKFKDYYLKGFFLYYDKPFVSQLIDFLNLNESWTVIGINMHKIYYG